MSGLESAASAFDAAIGGRAAPASRGDDSGSNAPTETMFGRMGVLDEDSDPAGGDDLPLKGQKKVKEPVVEEEEDPDQLELEDGEDEQDADDDADGEDDEDVDPKAKKKAEEDEDDDEPVYEVTVDGERVEVPLREALDGYIRQETFSRRLNFLNEAKETIRNEAVKVVELRNTYSTKLEEAIKLMDIMVPQEPDWEQEYTRDPAAAKVLQQQFNAFKTQREALRTEATRVSEEQKAEDKENHTTWVKTENEKILRNHPQWAKDKDVMAKDIAAMADTARKAGFSDEEIKETKDSRMITLLAKAMKYDRLQANRPKPIRRGNKPVKPGAGSNSTAPKAMTKAQQQLSRTGSVEDAGSVFTQLIRPRR
jgi:hypothetical protein